MLAARVIQTFDFADISIAEKLSFEDDDFKVLSPVEAQTVEIIDLDGKVRAILHPGNKSDSGLPGMTASNVPLHDFVCRITPRKPPTI